MSTNTRTLLDLGDGLALLYTTTNGRVGHEDSTELLTEVVDELKRLADTTRSRLRPPANTVRGAAGDGDGLGTYADVTRDIAAMQHAAMIEHRISVNLRYVDSYRAQVSNEDNRLLKWMLADVLDRACACLCWGVTE
ncbi:hypothetical protein [Dactylosporangium sp. NPDC050588]|uniref:hypothetical protein n=1 Tax=Dactylosporangium sp. NPDC050588 TaxID=3157211 RepID=UPI0033F6A14A